MKRIIWSLALVLACRELAAAQALPVTLRARVVNLVTSSNTVIDNRSSLYQNFTHTFYINGTGSWSVTIQYADGTPSTWNNFTIGAPTVTNSSAIPVGVGYGYHDFIRFSFTGSAS